MRYESRWFIKCVKQFVSPSGSRSFHLKWPIGKLSNTHRVQSGTFDPRPSKSICRDLVWQFEISCTETEVVVRLIRSKDDWPNRNDLYIARIMLRNERSGAEQFGKSCLFVTGELPVVWNLPIDKSRQADDVYVLHWFFDAPTDLDKSNLAGVDNTEDKRNGLVLLSWGLVEMYSDVIHQAGKSENSTSDVDLITKQNGIERRFYCHRNILSMRSLVFKTMLGNKKFNEARERVVEIEDIDTETTKFVLQ